MKLKKVSTSSTAIFEYNTDLELTIFPNPVSNILYLNIEKNATITIVNAQSTILSIHQNTNSIDMSKYQSGVYVVKIENLNKVLVKKIIKIDD